MYNFKPELVKALDKVLPTYYELFVDSDTETPCLTYLEINNTANKEGDTLRYSDLSFRIKIWGKDYSQLNDYVPLLDKAMYRLGFKRVAYNELSAGGMWQLIFTYSGMALENNV